MRRIRPDASQLVPRGTTRQLWRHPVDSVHYQAIAGRLKTQIRVPFGPENCALERGEFDQLDLMRGTPERTFGRVALGLRARIKSGAEMRSIHVAPAVKPGDVIFCGTPQTKLEDAPESLLVLEVRPERLRTISDADASAEGAEYWTLENRGDGHTMKTARAIAYMELTKFMRRQSLNRWLKTEDHHAANDNGVTPRHLFTLDWIRVRGFQSWLLNPWVWVLTFEMHAVRPLPLVRRLEEERRSA